MGFINRELLVKEFENRNKENAKWTPARVNLLIHSVQNIDVKPLFHGKWIFVGRAYDRGYYKDYYRCSCCWHEIDGVSEDYQYCPCCGAKMDLDV